MISVLAPLVILLAACPGGPEVTRASAVTPLERANGLDDDGDGEIDEPVSTDELDYAWDEFYTIARSLPVSGAALPDLVPLSTSSGMDLVASTDLLRDRAEGEAFTSFRDGPGSPASDFGYTADLDGDGLAELFMARYVHGPEDNGYQSTYGFASGRLAAGVDLGNPDYECLGDGLYTESTGMYDVGPLSGSVPLVACGGNDDAGSSVRIYEISAFNDGFASPAEATRQIVLDYWEEQAPVVGDLDGDGIPDVVIRGASTLVYSGGGFTPGQWIAADASFRLEHPTLLIPEAIADMTGDGRADLVVTEASASDDERGGTSFVVDVRGAGGELEALANSSFSVGAGWDVQELAAVSNGDEPASLALGLQGFDDEPLASAVWLVPGVVLAQPGAHTPEEECVRIVGPEPGVLGGTVNASWDLDEDGMPELAVGGYEIDGTHYPGRGWLLLDAASR